MSYRKANNQMMKNNYSYYPSVANTEQPKGKFDGLLSRCSGSSNTVFTDNEHSKAIRSEIPNPWYLMPNPDETQPLKFRNRPGQLNKKQKKAMRADLNQIYSEEDEFADYMPGGKYHRSQEEIDYEIQVQLAIEVQMHKEEEEKKKRAGPELNSEQTIATVAPKPSASTINSFVWDDRLMRGGGGKQDSGYTYNYGSGYSYNQRVAGSIASFGPNGGGQQRNAKGRGGGYRR